MRELGVLEPDERRAVGRPGDVEVRREPPARRLERRVAERARQPEVDADAAGHARADLSRFPPESPTTSRRPSDETATAIGAADMSKLDTALALARSIVRIRDTSCGEAVATNVEPAAPPTRTPAEAKPPTVHLDLDVDGDRARRAAAHHRPRARRGAARRRRAARRGAAARADGAGRLGSAAGTSAGARVVARAGRVIDAAASDDRGRRARRRVDCGEDGRGAHARRPSTGCAASSPRWAAPSRAGNAVRVAQVGLAFGRARHALSCARGGATAAARA